MKNSLNKKIENLFEQSEIASAKTEKQRPIQSLKQTDKKIILDQLQLRYTPVDDYTLLENISYLATHLPSSFDNWNLFFTRLIPFFEIGFLFNESKLKNQFLYGKSLDCTKKITQLKLPKSDLFQILKTSPKAFLQKLNLSSVLYPEKMTCFYVRVDENISLILITTKAEPWLKLKMDSLQKALINHQL